MFNCDLIDVTTGRLEFRLITTRTSVPLPPGGAPAASEYRTTTIRTPDGQSVATISWEGRKPGPLSILDEEISGIHKLFGTSTVRFEPKILAIPTRFDTEYIWTATSNSLTIFDHDTETTKGAFHRNSFRVGNRFIRAKISGLGRDYLEFEPHFLAEPIEFVVSFLMMEILRRARFLLTPYDFNRQRFRTLCEIRSSLIGRFTLRKDQR